MASKSLNVPVCQSVTTDLINHIVFVIDASGSMSSLAKSVIQVFDGQIQYLATRSQELNQETRISVYFFSDVVKCVTYDKDVMRLPSLKESYVASGSTSLLDGTMRALEDLEKTAQLYGDHAFLIYVITDGEENHSKVTPHQLTQKISQMPPNWTLAVLVPNQTGVFESKKFGFLPNNIQIWDTNQDGLQKAGDSIQQATNAFLTNRAQGIRGTSSLFQINSANLESVAQTLQEVDPQTYRIFPTVVDVTIRDFVETNTNRPYVKGSSFYQLTKKELIQKYKRIYIQENTTKKMFGGDQARTLLGFPDQDVNVKPTDHQNYMIFVESTSVNRKILGGTYVLVVG